MKTIATAAFAAALSCVCASAVELSGSIRNQRGFPVGGLQLAFYRQNGAGFESRTTVTAASGKWSIELPAGTWRGAAHNDAILSRGYFCAPGIVLCIDEHGEFTSCAPDGEWPPFWGGGEIEWIAIDDPRDVTLTLIPLRPELTVEKPRTPDAAISVTFETTSVQLEVVRQWRIEKSADLVVWTPLRTVALEGSSPVLVPDPSSEGIPVCYYRAVQVEDVLPP